MLELAVLGLLKEQDLHGYELKKRLVEMLGPISKVSFGSLYPALARLEAAGAVQATADEGTPRSPSIPMTGSLGGELAAFRARRSEARAARGESPKARRGRKVYRITDKGEKLFAELLATDTTSSEDDRGFNLRLAFARHLPASARIGLLERRRNHLSERLSQARGSLRSTQVRPDNYTHALMEHRTEVTERDITWLDTLIQLEKSNS